MLKKILLVGLLLNANLSLQADSSGFWAFVGGFLGSLVGSSNQAPQNNHVPYRPAANQARLRCACGETSLHHLMTRDCCGAQICTSCLTARRDTAIRNHKNLLCNCGKTIEDLGFLQQAAALNHVPTAPAINNNNQVNMCASDCNSVGKIRLLCSGRHVMCASCLRSRAAKAMKKANGDQPYVTCPKCGDMLTINVIQKAIN